MVRYAAFGVSLGETAASANLGLLLGGARFSVLHFDLVLGIVLVERNGRQNFGLEIVGSDHAHHHITHIGRVMAENFGPGLIVGRCLPISSCLFPSSMIVCTLLLLQVVDWQPTLGPAVLVLRQACVPRHRPTA